MNMISRAYWRYHLRHSIHRYLFARPIHNEYVSLDCETTSLDPRVAEIVTIAATKIIDNRIITSDPFEVRLSAPKSLGEDAVKIHHITHDELKHGISEKQAISALLDFIGNRPLIGYHIRYDKKILDRAAKKHLGFPLPNELIEVSQIYNDKLLKLLPNGYFDLSLEAICRHLQIPSYHKHNALEDAKAAAMVYLKLTRGSLPPFRPMS
ncbi:DNA polymerase III PolC-type [Vibrio thalassae]|uniref:DNA-directed DNA polymerase n=2 Tax=Vibrio thalassae TaxID=1243014 RepID=A0A240EFY6_9VIBR|nr:3'-5' exonuclease [Vibrio thalassae]SNX47441.1 DNA polymerase III PolC-type [Vibrio thalassae]